MIKKEICRMIGAVSLFSVSFAHPVFCAQPFWLQQEDGWYYYLEDGTAGTGWIEDKGSSYYLLENGRCLLDTITPDGYYVDGNGAWYKRKSTILGFSFDSPDKFISPGQEWGNKTSLLSLRDKINDAFGKDRRFRVSNQAIEYTLAENKTTSAKTASGTANETVLIGLYREANEEKIRLDIKLKLEPGNFDEKKASAYDYAVFKTMLYQISSSPEILEAALLNAWQGDNHWQINRDGWVRAGDSLIMYTPGNGFGRFLICPAKEGN